MFWCFVLTLIPTKVILLVFCYFVVPHTVESKSEMRVNQSRAEIEPLVIELLRRNFPDDKLLAQNQRKHSVTNLQSSVRASATCKICNFQLDHFFAVTPQLPEAFRKRKSRPRGYSFFLLCKHPQHKEIQRKHSSTALGVRFTKFSSWRKTMFSIIFLFH